MTTKSSPGFDTKGFRDPSANCIMTFVDAAARDAWVTANCGTTAGLPAGFQCFLTTAKLLNIWDGAAWRASPAAFTP